MVPRSASDDNWRSTHTLLIQRAGVKSGVGHNKAGCPFSPTSTIAGSGLFRCQNGAFFW